MDIRLLETIQNYPEVYEYLTSTKEVTLDQLKDYASISARNGSDAHFTVART